MIGGAAGSGPEGEHEGVDRIRQGIHRRQNDGLVVAIGARSGGSVPVEVAAAVMRRGGRHIGIAEVGGSIVQVVPAEDVGTRRTGTGGHILKAIGERNADIGARSGEGGSVCQGSVAAVGADAENICCIRLQAGHRHVVAGLGGRGNDIGPDAVVGGAIVNIPGSLLIAGNPGNLDIVVGTLDSSDCGSIAGGLGQAFATTCEKLHVGAPVRLVGTGGIHLGGTVGSVIIIDSVGQRRVGRAHSFITEGKGCAIVRTTVVDNGHHNVAGTVIGEDALVETKVVIAIDSAVQRAGVDQRQIAVRHKGRVGRRSDGERGACGVAHIYQAVGSVGHGL